jgi:LCP family protein required for cell wall assembly
MEGSTERPDKTVAKPIKKVGKVILLVALTILLAVFTIIGIVFSKYPLLGCAAYNFVTAPKEEVLSSNGNVNILIMGKSGGDHDGPDLTDTMIVTSVSLTGSEIKTVSIPRDIWIPDMMAKINAAYYWGKTGSIYFDSTTSGGGIGLAKKITEVVVGQPIQYGVVIDFSSFEDIVNALGGIEVNVERGFTDKLYPIEGRENDLCNGDKTFACRYESITFDVGNQMMDGATALKFVRSRHAEGDEGTDIAREARQQKVISAIKDKIMRPRTFLSIKVDMKLIDIAKKYIETDIDLPTAGTLARFALEGSTNVKQLTIPEGLLINPPTGKVYENLYVFIPNAGNGNWEDLNKWFTSVLSN